MIPKTIHYCWFGRKKMPSQIVSCIESWKKNCPDYQLVLWNEDNFDISINKYVKQAYEAKKWAFVTDFARLWIIYHYGGIYLDTDVEVIRSFDDLLNYKAFFGIEDTNDYYVATGLGFGAEKGNPIVHEIQDQYKDISFKQEAENSFTYDMLPCPCRNSIVFEKYGFTYKNEVLEMENFIIFPTDYFCPKNYRTGMVTCTTNTYSIHHYNGNWENTSTKIKKKIAKIIKYDKGIKEVIK